MRVVMASLLRERGLPGSEGKDWSPAVDGARVLVDDLDLEADRRMLERAERGPGVFDAWALPWLYPDPSAVRVWIAADLPSRIQRCRRSAIARGLPVPGDPAALLKAKDEFSRRRFQRLYGFDLEPSPETFDVVAENSQLLPELSRHLFEADVDRFNRELILEIESARRAKVA
jgi:cytidylate kinase